MIEKIKKQPIVFHPQFKSVIWGGNKICEYKSIDQPYPNIGESWEVSAVKDSESIVAEGPYKDKSIVELIDLYGEDLLGKNVTEKYGNKFPLLIKFIDANDNLSIQVHPDDILAKERHGSLGKTEMWYIIQSEKEAKILSGFSKAISKEEYKKRVAESSLIDVIASHNAKEGDVFYLPAGRIHSIGAGNFLAEIQESSDITYRIFDYNRVDSNGNPRELHTDLAVDAIDFKVYDDYKKNIRETDENVSNLVECQHFSTLKLNVKEDLIFPLTVSSFYIVIGLEGSLEIKTEEGQIELLKCKTVLLPAIVNEIKLKGTGKLLLAFVT